MTTEQNPACRPEPYLFIRLGVLCSVFLLEFIFLTTYFYGSTEYLRKIDAPGTDLIDLILFANLNALASIALILAAAVAIVLASRWQTISSGFQNAASLHSWGRWLTLQVCSFTAFILITNSIVTQTEDPQIWLNIEFSLWILTLGLMMLFALLTLAGTKYWLQLVNKERLPIALALIISLAAWFAAGFTQQLWGTLADWTYLVTREVLGLFYDTVVAEPQTNSLGTSSFSVRIGHLCSGYEGMGLITAFTAFYLWLFRKELRFPLALMLLPIGIVVIWCFNILRITTLIAIGTSLSPEIALTGFHSQAGWISFITVTLLVLWLAHRFLYRAVDEMGPETAARLIWPDNHATALLAPVIALFASAIITGAFSAGFNWLYPLHVILIAAVLLWLRNDYPVSSYRFHYEPLALGLFVFVIWMALVPASAVQTQTMADHLSSASAPVALLWLLFRALGACLFIPIAEELAFRGYLLARLSGQEPMITSRLPFRWLAFLSSSLLFGLLHDAWLAGAIAGACYALARYRRGDTRDAIVAHMVTNTLLTLYVITTGEWSYW